VTTTSRTSTDPATGTKRATKTAAKKTGAVKAVPKPTRAATGATASSPTLPPAAHHRPAKDRRAASASASAEAAATRSAGTEAGPGLPPTRPGEEQWSLEEVAEVRAELEADAARLHREIGSAELGIADLLRDSGEGAGDDQADAGTKNFEREHEMAIANNTREMLQQTERALARLAGGTYGICESCGEAVGKYRLQAFPRATLCMPCKQKQERR
jgi:RNA polymerase-binding protein DksA